MMLVETKGAKLNVELAGDKGAPVIVLSNSLGSDLTMWQPQMAALTRHFQVLRYDTRGHGKSSIPAGASTIDQLGQDALDLADHFGFARFHACGLSLGGGTVQWLAAHAPHRIDRLVIANSSSFFGPKQNWADRIRAVNELKLTGIAPNVMQRWLSETCRNEHPEILATLQAMFIKTDPKGYISCCEALRDLDLNPGLPLITAKTLVIAGTLDSATPMADSEWMVEKIPDAKLVKLEAGHLSNWEKTPQFNNALLSFLQH